jgi:hypothetical protein
MLSVSLYWPAHDAMIQSPEGMLIHEDPYVSRQCLFLSPVDPEQQELGIDRFQLTLGNIQADGLGLWRLLSKTMG